MLVLLLSLTAASFQSDSLSSRDVAEIATLAVEATLTKRSVIGSELPQPIRVDLRHASSMFAFVAGRPLPLRRDAWLPRTPFVEASIFITLVCPDTSRVSQRCRMREPGTLVRVAAVTRGPAPESYAVSIDVIVPALGAGSRRHITGYSAVVDVTRCQAGWTGRVRSVQVP